MTVAIICLTAVILAEFGVFWYIGREWSKERQNLLERIQRPERIPAEKPDLELLPPLETDEIAEVGNIHYDDGEAEELAGRGWRKD